MLCVNMLLFDLTIFCLFVFVCFLRLRYQMVSHCLFLCGTTTSLVRQNSGENTAHRLRPNSGCAPFEVRLWSNQEVRRRLDCPILFLGRQMRVRPWKTASFEILFKKQTRTLKDADPKMGHSLRYDTSHLFEAKYLKSSTFLISTPWHQWSTWTPLILMHVNKYIKTTTTTHKSTLKCFNYKSTLSSNEHVLSHIPTCVF